MDVASKKPLLENLMIMLALNLRRLSMISYSSILKVMTIEHNGDTLTLTRKEDYVVHFITAFAHSGTQGDDLIFCGSGTTASIKRLQEVTRIAIPLNLREKVTTRRPMLGYFSACSIVTRICSVLCLACFASLEHSHALISQQDIDMRSAVVVDGYDAITLSPHKFLGRPGSPGILLMNKALYQLKNSPPSTCGTVNYVNYYDEKVCGTVDVR
ncbi:pyridoxal phosphate-dependent transferase [Tanacetum coccineum]|uniref:Pyridoxal phosphate-dependent transferase n=1 Tax=Tanacetum coccineum TaxID=301880 RepID=A0ABQ5HH65_9ASTR